MALNKIKPPAWWATPQKTGTSLTESNSVVTPNNTCKITNQGKALTAILAVVFGIIFLAAACQTQNTKTSTTKAKLRCIN